MRERPLLCPWLVWISHGSYCFTVPTQTHSTTASLAFRSLRNRAIVFTVPSASLIWLSTRVCRLISILSSFLQSYRPWNSQIFETPPRLSIPSQRQDTTIQVSSCLICGQWNTRTHNLRFPGRSGNFLRLSHQVS